GLLFLYFFEERVPEILQRSKKPLVNMSREARARHRQNDEVVEPVEQGVEAGLIDRQRTAKGDDDTVCCGPYKAGIDILHAGDNGGWRPQEASPVVKGLRRAL